MQGWAFCKTASVAAGTLSLQFPSAVTALINVIASLRIYQPSGGHGVASCGDPLLLSYEVDQPVITKNKRDEK